MSLLNHTFALLGPIGMPEMIVLGLLGVLIFGKRLPEVGRSVGQGLVEFKKGLQGIEPEKPSHAPKPTKRLEPEAEPTKP